MAKKPAHGLKETKGTFKVRGLATVGDIKENTYDSGAKKVEVNIGVNTTETNKVYIKTGNYVNDIVRFYSNEKKECREVPYSEKDTFKEGDFRLMGISVGIEKDDSGENKRYTLQEFEVPKYLKEVVKPNIPLFISGKLEFSSFKGKDGIIRMKNLVASKIYGAKSINFEADDFVEENAFKQTIVFDSIEKTDDDRFVVSCYIVGYKSIEKTEFLIEDKKIANAFRKNLKSGNAIDVYGRIVSERIEEEVSTEDVWGEADPFKTTTSTKKEYLITGADPSTIDKESYSVDIILEKIKEINEAKEQYGKTKQDKEIDDWGKTNDIEDDDDEDFPF